MTGVDDDVVVVLDPEASWDFLRTQQVGRLAYHLLGEVHIVPLNFAVTGGRIVFRTAPGSKLLGIVMDQDVAFEADQYDLDVATSVVVRGVANLLADREADEVRALPVQSWLRTDKDEVVAIDVREISGRTFVLDRREPSRSG
ncbi:pyridoxamine 5'-phosphate oxidase family protein [uncultured Cellulomonas sp.]|uniref:pyridoxamine 5'-phosphate oxidase family protein n=1 Tax=uncultured Cellulomonas sp. TaxID=189682 RepID=UPI0026083CEB|nr:pyridoxamine 5'-phosphate oxidase family protein [uncultured Cellulomonas sp.]